jgi:hypothetical protein
VRANGTAKSQSGTLVAVTGSLTRYVIRTPRSSGLSARFFGLIPCSIAQARNASEASCHWLPLSPAPADIDTKASRRRFGAQAQLWILRRERHCLVHRDRLAPFHWAVAVGAHFAPIDGEGCAFASLRPRQWLCFLVWAANKAV